MHNLATTFHAPGNTVEGLLALRFRMHQLSARDGSSIPCKNDVDLLSGVVSDQRLLLGALAEGPSEAAVLVHLVLQLLSAESEPL